MSASNPIQYHKSNRASIVEYNYDDKISYERGDFRYAENENGLSSHFFPPSTKPSPQNVLRISDKELIEENVLKKVIPERDGRMPVNNSDKFPYCIHGQLEMIFPDGCYGGSGSMVGPHHMLTCAHNIYDETKKHWAKSIKVYPAKKGKCAPFGQAEVTKAYLYENWTKQGDRNFDIALLILNQSIGNLTGWGGICCTKDTYLKASTIHITGYPGDKGFDHMWTMEHTIQDVSSEVFEYIIDTFGGQSGSAVWSNSFGHQPNIFGVHTLGGARVNYGVRISRKKFTDLIVPFISNTYKKKSVISSIQSLSISERMDPLPVATAISDVGHKICTEVEKVKVNHQQCHCLAKRVQTITNAVQEFVRRPASKESSGYFVDGLKALKGTLHRALDLATSLSQQSWFKRVIRTGTDKEKFCSIYAQLEEDVSQLNLGINVQQLMDKKEEKEAAQRDWAHIQSQQDEILRLNQEAKKKMQQLAMDEKSRQKILTQQFQSMQFAIQQLEEGKRQDSPFSEELIVPFHEVNIDGLINKEHFGEVYTGRYLEQEVTVKMLAGKLTPLEKEEFVREVKIMKQLRSDYVMQLDGACYEPGTTCILMKHMQEGTLTKHLQNNSLTPLQKHELALGIALGLHYLHSKGIIHRDLKGESILIDQKGNPRIADYGLSKAVNMPSIMTIHKASEALGWLAPEIALDKDGSGHTHETDIYSYGTLLWHIMTGKEPYAGCSQGVIAKKLARFETETIPQQLPLLYRKLIAQCWEQKRSKRPTLEEIIHTLRTHSLSPQNTSSPSSLPSAEDHYHAGIGYESYKLYDQARTSYEKAAQLNHTKAKTNLAFFYLRGKGGLPQDKQRAHDLFLEAANEGHTRAMEALAKQLSSGDGVPKNEEQAQFWLQKSH